MDTSQINNTDTVAGAPSGTPAQNTNMRFYNELRMVPEEAKKPILDGRLRGKTDVNGMWRIKRMTEIFGPCGIGWKYTIRSRRTEKADENNIAAFVDIDLYVKDPATGQWSEPIPGTGGNIFKRIENSGKVYMDDDCYKKAFTDALSIACKAIGLAADVWFEQDKSKYENDPSRAAGPLASTQTEQRNRPPQSGKSVLNPASRYWVPSVARAAGTTDPPARIRQRIENKFTITDSDFALLMQQAGKPAA